MVTTTTATPGASNDMTPTNNSAWYEAEVVAITTETATTKTLTFRLPHPVSHLAGQHYEIRLTAADGYQAARLYSAASIAEGNAELQLTVVDTPDGEVSPYVTTHLKVGDHVEIRGPLGRFFVWNPQEARPVLLLAGGSGVVPMRAILRAHAQVHAATPMRLLYSVRTVDDIIYRDEFLSDPRVIITLTRPDQAPADWQGPVGHLNKVTIRRVLDSLGPHPLCYVCGMDGFVEAAVSLLLDAGVPPSSIKAERFGAA